MNTTAAWKGEEAAQVLIIYRNKNGSKGTSLNYKFTGRLCCFALLRSVWARLCFSLANAFPGVHSCSAWTPGHPLCPQPWIPPWGAAIPSHYEGSGREHKATCPGPVRTAVAEEGDLTQPHQKPDRVVPGWFSGLTHKSPPRLLLTQKEPLLLLLKSAVCRIPNRDRGDPLPWQRVSICRVRL